MTSILSRRRLNRTLLLRQHLLERATLRPEEMIGHLVGLQAQEPLPPYLSLAARLTDVDPWAVSGAIEDRSLVRVLSLRDTVHLHVPEDARTLPVWASPVRERELRASQTIGEAREVDRDAFAAAVREVLADGPLPQRELAAALAERFPAHTAAQLGQVARVTEVLAQLPPRGCWKPEGSTSVSYDFVERWTGAPLTPPDVPEVIRRYLRAFGPATAADVTAWSGITRLGPVVKAMDDLVRHEDEDGRPLWDLADAPLADGEQPAPVRLLGNYDNLWLSHAGRDRVTTPERRKAWMGVNGSWMMTIFVDGWLEGLYRLVDGRVSDIELLRPLTRSERSDLDDEVARVEALLAR
ncbi:winged helix DNA-binding domain-containing protein [Nocardioides caeni]|uniref:Winged helix DNA-binding domain-containing protein n=1 Tax=Nocardioides caeni TaxID=574700 RepID=A0A4V4HLB7_9ACTN|nr:winged helix DNA-binding domain-containing protein [Nocardioides caeni]THV17636.1 winged helix DNA-binding domain-containing protein [Nocardioides caeni]